MSNKLRILILEDSVDDTELIEHELRRAGLDFVSKRVETEEAFISGLEGFAPDIILSDYQLPSFDGISALTRTIETLPDVPFLFVSGTMGEELAVEMLKNGATDYVLKDRLAKLAPAVQRALNEKYDRIKHRLAEQALKISEERYRRITEAISDYIYTVRIENGQPVETSHSEACFAVTGYTGEEFKDDPYLWLKMVIEEDRPLVKRQAEEVLSGHFPRPIEHRIIRKDLVTRWVESTMVPNYDIHNTLVSYDGILRDITERRNLEAQLLHSQKMEAVGQLAGGIAHDFNNILSAVINYLYLLGNKAKDDNALNEDIRQISSLVMKASDITKGLLAFSRKHVITSSPVNLNASVRNMEKLLGKFIGEDIEISLRLTDREPVIMSDNAQIEQIIINLATNARDVMPGGGQLSIETDVVTIDSTYVKNEGFGQPGTYALLTVTDTGSGMDEETRQKIFEPFFTTKGIGRGTGLGLAIIYGVVTQHKGFIHVSSCPGKGTTFRIYLPVIKGDFREPEKTGSPDLSGHGETILLTEDEEAVRKSLRFILEKYGYRVIEAMDGESAIDIFRQRMHEIDLLLLDVILPKKHGRDVYETIIKIKPGIKAIFTSGYSGEIINSKRIIQDGLRYITKPVLPDQLLAAIMEVLKSGK